MKPIHTAFALYPGVYYSFDVQRITITTIAGYTHFFWDFIYIYYWMFATVKLQSSLDNHVVFDLPNLTFMWSHLAFKARSVTLICFLHKVALPVSVLN
jgi:hypothetical protein